MLLNSEVQFGLENNQRAFGRISLSLHGKATNESLQGDRGCASFEVREAQNLLQKMTEEYEQIWMDDYVICVPG